MLCIDYDDNDDGDDDGNSDVDDDIRLEENTSSSTETLRGETTGETSDEATKARKSLDPGWLMIMKRVVTIKVIKLLTVMI